MASKKTGVQDLSLLEQPAQFSFLDSPTDRYTKSFGLWDLTPWQVTRMHAELRDGDYLKSIERTFEARGRMYRLTLHPARLKRDGKIVEEYPGEREGLIELALRKLAIRQRNFKLVSGELVSLSIRLYDLYKELQSNKHPFTYPQIEEGLNILANASFEISRPDMDIEGDVSDTTIKSAMLPTMKIRKYRNDDTSQRTTVHIQVNALLAEAIRNLDFHDVNYETLMGLRPIERWIFKRSHHMIVFGMAEPDNSVTMTASAIRDACGLNIARPRQMFTAISGQIKRLVDLGIVETVTETPTFQGEGKLRSKVDVAYRIVPTSDFLEQALRAQSGIAMNLDRFKTLSGGKRPSEGWLPTPPRIATVEEEAPAPVRKPRAKRKTVKDSEPTLL